MEQDRGNAPESKVSLGAKLERVVVRLSSTSIEMIAVGDFLRIKSAERFRDEKLGELQRKDLTEEERHGNESNLGIAEQRIALAKHSKDGNASKPGYRKAFDQIQKKFRALQKEFESKRKGNSEAKEMAIITLEHIVDWKLVIEERALSDFYKETN